MESTDKNSFSDIFSQRLRALMKERGLTQMQVAAHCGVKQPTVQQWLQGVLPKAYEIHRLDSLFGFRSIGFLEAALEKNAEKLEAAGIEVQMIPPDLEFVQREREFWKTRALQLQQELEEIEHKIRSVLGMGPPKAIVPAKDTTLRNTPRAPGQPRTPSLKDILKTSDLPAESLMRDGKAVESKSR